MVSAESFKKKDNPVPVEIPGDRSLRVSYTLLLVKKLKPSLYF